MLTTRCLKCNVTIEVTGGTAPPKKDEFVMVASDSHGAVDPRDTKEVTANSLQSKAKKIERLISVAHGDTELEGAQGVCDVCVTKIINEAKRKVAATKEKKRAIEAALRRLNDEEADSKVRSSSNIEDFPGSALSNVGSDGTSMGLNDKSNLGQGGSTAIRKLPPVSLNNMSNEEIMRKVAVQEEKLMRELASLKQEEEDLKEESYKIDEEMRDLDETEQRFWSDEFADFQAALMDCEDQKAQSSVLLSYAKNQLQRLKRTNALNDVFYISSHGPFGCINNYRLGRLPENSPAVVGGIGSGIGSGGSTLIGGGSSGGRDGIGGGIGSSSGNVVSNVGSAVGGVVSNVVGGVGGVVSDVVGGVGGVVGGIVGGIGGGIGAGIGGLVSSQDGGSSGPSGNSVNSPNISSNLLGTSYVSNHVSWDEINAAWGFTCLLLDVIIKKMEIPPNKLSYRLLPSGSFSSIIRLSEPSVIYELHCSDGGLSRFFIGRRFDTAMGYFLHCLDEVANFIHDYRSCYSLRLPFQIDPELKTIGGFKIQMQMNELERWTKALKFLLINMKWLIAFVEGDAEEEEGRGRKQ